LLSENFLKAISLEIQTAFVAIFGNVLHQKPATVVRTKLLFRPYGRIDKTVDHALVGGYAKSKKGN
jgi:hypothetical protein